MKRTLAILLVVVLAFFISLFFREQRLPKFLVDRIAQSLSSRQYVVRCESIAVGFRHGLRVVGLRVFDMSHEDSLENPMLSVRSAIVNVFNRKVRVAGVAYHKLPDSYYEPSGDEPHVDEPVVFDVPDLPEFKLILEDSAILGIVPEKAVARISTRPGRIEVEDIQIKLTDKEGCTSLAGEFVMDLVTQHARGEVTGTVMHSQIRPFMEIIDAPSSLPYIDAFTEITEPIPSRVMVDVDLTRKNVDVLVDVRPKMGRYQGVPLSRAEGTVDFKFRYEQTNEVCRLKVDLPVAVDHDGHRLSGYVGVDNASGPYRLNFSATSDLRFKDALQMLDLIDPEDLSMIECFSSPEVKVMGTACTGPDDLAANDLGGKVFLRRGAFNGFRFNDLSGDFTFKRDVLKTDVRATGKTGGRLDLTGAIDFNDFKPGKAGFSVKGTYRNGSLEELGDMFTFDLGERNGKVDWDIDFSGLLATNTIRALNGKGRVVVSDGHLAQMKLFAGLTTLLAEKIPGVSFLVNQTQASADYTIVDGIFHSDNVYIEGGFISIKGWGKYDIAADNLDFTVRAQFLKKESFAGKIVHPVTLPFTKLLLEFKVNGPIDEPTWKYIKILDRIF